MTEENNQTSEPTPEQPVTRVPSAEPKKRSWLGVIAIFGGLFLMFFFFVSSALIAANPEGNFDFGSEKIGVVEVTGPIMSSKEVTEALKEFREDKQIKGIVVRVDSPGGSVAPSQEMFEAVKAAEAKKPLAISMGGTAASGGYYTAIGSKKIFANNGTITGSIGVITQLFDVSQIVEMAHVEVNTIKTGPYKDTGSPFREFNETDRNHLNVMIKDVYDQFVEDVAEARGMKPEAVRQLADGRVFTGRQAKKNGLVDEIGTFEDTVAWVAEAAKIDGEPKLVYPKKESNPFADLLKGSVQSFVKETKAQTTPSIEYRYVGPQ